MGLGCHLATSDDGRMSRLPMRLDDVGASEGDPGDVQQPQDPRQPSPTTALRKAKLDNILNSPEFADGRGGEAGGYGVSSDSSDAAPDDEDDTRLCPPW